jgi:ATP-dependent Clp protease adaptor protein ClpS
LAVEAFFCRRRDTMFDKITGMPTIGNMNIFDLRTRFPAVVAAGNDDDKDGDNGGPDVGVVIKTRPKVKKPSMYKVLMLNDDYTPMEFVVHVLEHVFSKNGDDATRIMLHVHQKGVGVCGVYTYEVAETKVTQTMDLARKHQHPLQCTLEKE